MINHIKNTTFALLLFTITVGFITPAVIAQEEPPAVGEHGDASERLVTIMRSLFQAVREEDMVHEENIPGYKAITSEQMNSLIESVEQLVVYSRAMAAQPPVSELAENDAVIFSAMAQRLDDEVVTLRQLATNYDFRVAVSAQQRLFNESYRRLNRTCAACHQLFRDTLPQG